mmetsp:Transcript_17112/g.25501  ORF Transcript_17112/g.25501 Transcript_17112/m.25501 type:complete len:85 (-) Transcript_17112:665-919(-)
MIESSAGVNFDAILLAIAALSLISPVSVEVDTTDAAEEGAVDADVDVSAAPNQDDIWENGLLPALPVVPVVPAVATEVPEFCRL